MKKRCGGYLTLHLICSSDTRGSLGGVHALPIIDTISHTPSVSLNEAFKKKSNQVNFDKTLQKNMNNYNSI
jgi:hypothetical protein